MTRDDIIRMAREAGVNHEPDIIEVMTRFAALVASERDIGWHKIVHDECEAAIKEEREACAKVAENGNFLHDDSPEAKFGKACAAAIRARN